MVRTAFSIADKVANVPASASATARAQSRALVVWSILAVPLGVLVILGAQDNPLISPISIGIFVGCAGLIAALLHLRRTARIGDASSIFALSILVGLGVSAWVLEVPDLLPFIFLAVTPVYVGLMVSWKKCLFYTAGLSVFLFALAFWAFINPNAPPETVTNVLGCALAGFGSGLSTTAYAYTTALAAKKLKRQNAEIATLAYVDAMTGIQNRRAFNERLNAREDQLADGPKLLAAIDLDGFKEINDRYGHEVGDEVLIELARRLRRAAPRGSDVYRVGGDEFAVIADGGELSESLLAVKLSAVSEDPYPTSAGALPVRISIGLATSKDTAGTLKRMYREADIALFETKRAEGKRWCLYSEQLGAAKNREARLTDLLRRAIAQAKLGIAFQPQYNISDRSITGVEALARWETDDFGAVTPGEFVPIADKSGLIVDLDCCVLKQAVSEAEEWLQAHQRLAVNVSGKTLLSPIFLNHLKSVITLSALDFNQLTIEITETEIIDNKAEAKTVCDALRALGVSIALDDFGTGYSSLSYLSTLPINTLKIDRSFVQSARTQSNLKIMKSIIGLANSMGLNLLVEGVERNWQLQTIVDLGCERVQGFYFSRPLTSAQCAALLGTSPSRHVRADEQVQALSA